jgi:hypothetical protein
VNQLIYPRDRLLTVVTMALGVALWGTAIALLIAVGSARSVTVTLVMVLLLGILGFLAYLFARSTLIAHLQGNGIELSEAQFPELHQQFVQCCDTLSISERPRAYILNGKRCS